jgi:hypothetical protein
MMFGYYNPTACEFQSPIVGVKHRTLTTGMRSKFGLNRLLSAHNGMEHGAWSKDKKGASEEAIVAQRIAHRA